MVKNITNTVIATIKKPNDQLFNRFVVSSCSSLSICFPLNSRVPALMADLWDNKISSNDITKPAHEAIIRIFQIASAKSTKSFTKPSVKINPPLDK